MNRNWELSPDFKFSYFLTDFDSISTSNYIEAIDKASLLVFEDAAKLNLNKIGLCISGADSELIARSLFNLGIYTEYFFLNIDGINSVELSICQNIAKRYNAKLNVVTITKNDLLETVIYENFNITPVIYPTYATLPVLIKNIPSDFYIVLGEGDIEKGWPRYTYIFKHKIKNPDHKNFLYVPEHLSEISYRLAINYYGKHGESNFYSRCFDTWYHILKDERLITDGVCLYDPKTTIFSSLIKEYNLISPIKTMNYENSIELRNHIKSNLINRGKQFDGWHQDIGDVVVLPKSLFTGMNENT